MNSKEECIHLTTNSQALEREVLLFQCVSIKHGVQHYICVVSYETIRIYHECEDGIGISVPRITRLAE